MNAQRLAIHFIPCLVVTLLLEIPVPSEEPPRTDETRRDDTKQSRGLPRELHRASDIIGKKVENEQGESLGKIEDIVLDETQAKIAYAVLSFGGVLGLGDKLFAIPWNALKENTDKKVFLLSVDKEKLKKAPGFDKKDWPDMANAEWAQGIHQYYGVGDGYRTLPAVDFGESSLQREPVTLPLAFKEGQSYRYRIDMETRGVSPRAEKDAEIAFRVAKVEGDKATIEANCTLKTASPPGAREAVRSEKAEGPTRFQVGKDGQITVLEVKTPPGEGKGADDESLKAQMKTRLEHIFGYRLHDQALQPGKEYTMPGSTRDLLDTDPSRRVGEQHRMKYNGVTRVGGSKVAFFEILPGAGATPAGREARPGPTPIFEQGKAAYRADDGLLELLSFGSTTVRRLPERGDLGN